MIEKRLIPKEEADGTIKITHAAIFATLTDEGNMFTPIHTVSLVRAGTDGELDQLYEQMKSEGLFKDVTSKLYRFLFKLPQWVYIEDFDKEKVIHDFLSWTYSQCGMQYDGDNDVG